MSEEEKSLKSPVRLPNPEEVVEQLLPSGLADYFFFDGESMITDLKAKGKDSANSLRDALYLMLDLSVYDKAVKYIGQQDRTTTTLGKGAINLPTTSLVKSIGIKATTVVIVATIIGLTTSLTASTVPSNPVLPDF